MEDIGDALELPCDFHTALELWIAYKEHGVMARAGGLLDQPRWWRTLIRLISSRHSPIQDAYMREKYPDNEDGTERRRKPKVEWDDGGLPVADGWGALNRGN